MSDVSKTPDNRPTPPKSSAVVLLLGDIADSTWRMFVPGIGGTLLGLWLDRQFGTLPWLLITGIVLGSVTAFMLVRRQLKKIAAMK